MKRIFACALMLFSVAAMASEIKLTCGWTTRTLFEDGAEFSVLLTDDKVESISFTTTFPPIITMHLIGKIKDDGIFSSEKVVVMPSYKDATGADFNLNNVILSSSNSFANIFSAHTFGTHGSQWLSVNCSIR